MTSDAAGLSARERDEFALVQNDAFRSPQQPPPFQRAAGRDRENQRDEAKGHQSVERARSPPAVSFPLLLAASPIVLAVRVSASAPLKNPSCGSGEKIFR